MAADSDTSREGAPSEEDCRRLYLEERERNGALERELERLKDEAAERERDNTMMSAQVGKILKDLHAVNKSLRQKVAELDKSVKNTYEAYKGTINRLVLASEYKDNETGNHILRMGNYCVFVAKLYGFDAERLEEIDLAAPMHDVGKIGIKDSILFKNGKLTPQEFEEMKKHTAIGADILKNPDCPILACARQIALCHHEKWNGRGYPNGIKGAEIPINARIVAICDTFDALTSKRPYKTPYPIDVSCDIIKKGRGVDFDPDLVDLFLANIDGFVAIKNRIDVDSASETIVKAEFKWSERDKEA